MNNASASRRLPFLGLLIVCLAGCSADREVDPVSALREEAYKAVRASAGSGNFDNLPQKVMPTIGAVCGQVAVDGRETRSYFYVRGQPVIVARDASSKSEVADRCRRAFTEVEEMKLLPQRP